MRRDQRAFDITYTLGCLCFSSKAQTLVQKCVFKMYMQ